MRLVASPFQALAGTSLVPLARNNLEACCLLPALPWDSSRLCRVTSTLYKELPVSERLTQLCPFTRVKSDVLVVCVPPPPLAEPAALQRGAVRSAHCVGREML